MTKPLTVWITTNYGKFLKRWENQATLPISWETCMWVKRQQTEPDREQRTSSNLRKEYLLEGYISSVQSLKVVSNSLWHHGLQHARLPCPSTTPRACSNACPSSQWCHPTISSSVVPFSSCLQSFPASGSFPVSWFFVSGGQSIGVSASASVLPMNIQDWSPLGFIGWNWLQFKGLSRVFSNTTVQKHQFFGAQLFHGPTLTSIHNYWKNHSFG